MSWRIVINIINSRAPQPLISVDSLPLATPKNRKASLILMRFWNGEKVPTAVTESVGKRPSWTAGVLQ